MIAAIFFVLSVLAIVAGGILSAFSARRPTRLTAWASAYLVLVVGVIQAGLAAAWYGLKQPGSAVGVLAFILYNLGNAAVLSGTILRMRHRSAAAFVDWGGILIAAAMVGLLLALTGTPLSPLSVIVIVLVAIIAVSMPIGLYLSHKRRGKRGEYNNRMNVAIKRIYDDPSADDGYRVLVDRLWPRGISKERAKLDEWLKEIAPSPELRVWFDHDPARFEEFAARYTAELDANEAVTRLQGSIKEHAAVTLLYAAHDPHVNHAAVLLAYLTRDRADR